MLGKIFYKRVLFQCPGIILPECKIKGMLDNRIVQLTKNLVPTVKILMESFEDQYDEILTLLDQRLIYNGLDLSNEDIEELANYYINSGFTDD